MGSKADDFLLGLEAGRRRDYTGALRHFTAWESDNHPEAWVWIARALLGLRRPQEAVMAFRAHLARFPNDSEAFFHLGRAYLTLEQYGKALHCFRTTGKNGNGPKHLPALIGYSYLKLRRPEAAKEWFEEAVRILPQHQGIYQGYLNSLLVYGISAFRNGNHELSLKVMEFLLDNGVEDDIVSLYRAASQRGLGKWSQAMAGYQALHEKHPEDGSFLLHYWECARQAGDASRASAASQKIRKLHPDLGAPDPSEVPVALAWKFFREGRYRTAITYALGYLKKTGEPAMHLLIGDAYYHLGQINKAVNHLRKAREILGSPEASYVLLRVLWAEQSWSDCRHEALALLRVSPGDRFGTYYKVLTESRLGLEGVDHTESIQKLLQSYPGDAQVQKELGLAMIRAGRTSEGATWLVSVLKTAPDDDESITALLQLDTVPVELAHWERVASQRKHPFVPLCLFLAETYWNLRRFQEARPHALQLLKLEPNHHKGWELLARIERDGERFPEAFAIWASILRKDPSNRPAILNVFYCLNRMGQIGRAETFRYKVIQQLGDRLLHYSFGKAFMKLGMPTRAVEEYLELLHYKPGHSQTLAALDEARRAEKSMVS